VIETLAGGDLDGDGFTDLVVWAGDAMYLIRGAVDLQATPTPLKSFTRRISVAYSAHAASVVETARGTAVLVVRSRDGDSTRLQVDVLDPSSLATLTSLPLDATGASVWVATMAFPGATELVIGAGDHLWVAPLEDVVAGAAVFRELPPPIGAWSAPVLAFTYAGTVREVVVATATSAFASPIPTDIGSPFNWRTLRVGARWFTQTSFDLNSDGHDELIGVEDGIAPKLCALDALTGAIGCFATKLADSYAEGAILTRPFSTNPLPDVFVVHTAAVAQETELHVGVQMSGSVLTERTMPGVGLLEGLPPIHLIPLLNDHNAIPRVLVVDANGLSAYCIDASAGEMQAC